MGSGIVFFWGGWIVLKTTVVFLFLIGLFACSSRPEGSCEKDYHCKYLQTCFEGHCMSVKQMRSLKEKRAKENSPKICKDLDGDGSRAGDGCSPGTPRDCDDQNASMAPGKTEICDEIDNNCDGRVNEGIKGCVQTLFGNAKWGNQSEHRATNITAVIYDPSGFVFVSDNHHIWKVRLDDGNVELLAGSSLSNFMNGPGPKARFSYPMGMALGSDGVLWVADCKNNCIRKISSDGNTSTAAGYCSSLTKDAGRFADGTLHAARFSCPVDVAHGADKLFVVDRLNGKIRKIGTARVETVAGAGPMEIIEGEGQNGFLDGPAALARFNDPQSILVDPKGIIYVAESFNCRIRRIDPKKKRVSTLAGKSDTLIGEGGFSDGPGAKTRFSYPHGMCFDARGNLLVADTGNAVIRRVRKNGRTSTIFGKPGQSKYVDGPLKKARLHSPSDLALGPAGSIFVVDDGKLRWIVF
jgi:sugar lactone lactonase YvrE